MAKKAKTEGVLAKATRLQAEADAEALLEREAERMAQEAKPVAEAPKPGSGRKRLAKEAAAAGPAAKRARYVRDKKETPPEAAPAPVPAPPPAAPKSASAAGRLLAGHVKPAPKPTAAPNRGPARPRPKP